MEIFEFVRFAEIDPIYLDSSYYVVPEEAGEKPYALLFDSMRGSGYVALAEFAMRRRERAVVIRAGQTGIIAHTLYYADEIRKADEYRPDTSVVTKKEKELALTLIEAMAAKFEPEKLKDTYRERLRELIAAKVAGQEFVAEAPAKAPPVVDITEALKRSLEMRRKPPASARPPARKAKKNQR
jgi:DNA end-binding protein Ku